MKGNQREQLIRHLQKSLAALATFTRIREKLILKRAATRPGEHLERLDRLIRINQEMLELIRAILSTTRDDFIKEIPYIAPSNSESARVTLTAESSATRFAGPTAMADVQRSA